MCWKLKGGHKQEIREGYNLFNLKKWEDSNVTASRCTIDKITENSITITSTDNDCYTNTYGILKIVKESFGITADSETDYTLYFEKDKNITGAVFVFEYDENETGSTNTQVAQMHITTSELKGAINFTTTSNTKYICFRLGISNSENTVTYKNIMLLKGTYTVDNIPTYEQYGASPSSDYPSEIETLNGSVKIDVVNKNLFDINDLPTDFFDVNGNEFKGKVGSNFNKKYYWYNAKGYDGDLTFKWKYKPYRETTEKGRGIVFEIVKRDGTFRDLNSILGEEGENQVTVNNVDYGFITFGTYPINAIYDFEIVRGSATQNYTEHQSQTAIMPVQQEMLNGDYIADVEHHVWGKLILTGDENWHKSSTTEVDRFSYNTSEYPAFAEGLSNYFLVQKGIGTNVGTLVFNAGTQIVVNFSDYGTTTLEEFKAWLKSKYDAKNPVIVYYKLATPTNLELTTEQKAIRDTKLNTYKNVTNISLSDELASIDVEYKKDLETINKNYENRLAALEAASIS